MPNRHDLDGVCYLLFLGTCIPYEMCRAEPGCSEAANNFQMHLLESLADKNLRVRSITVASLLAVASYPRNRRILIKKQSYSLNPKIELTIVPFVNFGRIIKNITAAISFSIFMIKTVVQGQVPDAVILYNLNLPYSLPAFVLRLLTGVPVFPIAADLPMPGSLSPRTGLRRVDAYLQKTLIKKGDGLITLSRAIAMDFAAGKPFLHMEGGIEVPRPCSGECGTVAKHVMPEIKSILYAGTLSENGGILLLIEAFKKVSIDNCELWICGRGDLEPEVKEVAQHDEKIRFFGFLERERLLELLSSSTILINPRPNYPENRYSFPSKLLEYLASGRPVITTATPDVSEEYRDKVFILWEETPEALAKLIEETSELPTEYLWEFGARAREYVLINKNWDFQARRVIDFLGEVIARRGGARVEDPSR